MNGQRLWMLHTGANMFNSAHTTPYIAWDLDGDGYGEFMVKTAPGAIDGEGNYVLLDGDDPNVNLKSGRGKQDHGP
jgi:rhamnogalacturonan endolyase